MKIFSVCFLLIIAAVGFGAFLSYPDSIGGTPEPEVIASVNGVLDTTLEATDETLKLDGVKVEASVFNGQYPGPVLRVHPGDSMHIHFINHTSGHANIHFHGLETSPLANGDNVDVTVKSGESYDYDVKVSDKQAPGLYWYHDHTHGASEKHVMKGLSGTIEVVGAQAQFSGLSGVKERILVLKDFDIPAVEGKQSAHALPRIIQTINGHAHIVLRMHSGETQFWRFTNQSPNRLFHMAIPGLTFRTLEVDGRPAQHETTSDMLEILPGGRVEALVTANGPGVYDLVTRHVMAGDGVTDSLDRVQGQVIVSGAAERSLPELRFPVEHDLKEVKIDQRRELVYTQSVKDNQYYIDGRTFSPNRVDMRIPLGHIEEWTIRNNSDDFHSFHIHQLHFQVTEIDGKEVPFNGYVDNVAVPAHGTVKVVIAFTDPAIVGKFVAHCHIMEHEDKGMMVQVEVYDPAAQETGSFFHPTADGAALTFMNQNGQKVEEKDFEGKYVLAFFGFTHCAHMCPAALKRMAAVMAVLKNQGKDVAPVFVSLDPVNDTPEALQAYLQPVGGTIAGLVGSKEQLQMLERLSGAYRNKAAENDNGGKFPGTFHSAYIYLLDKEHKYVTAYAVDASTWWISEDMQKHLGNAVDKGAKDNSTGADAKDSDSDDDDEMEGDE